MRQGGDVIPRLVYLCLQATREGQASHAHVHEIIRGLSQRGWDVQLVEPAYASPGEPLPGPVGRLVEFLRIEARAARLARGAQAIYIRAHFAAFPIALWARARRLPVVQEMNGPYEDLFIAWPWTRRFAALFKFLFRAQLKWADEVITVTPGLANWIKQETGRRRVSVIPNGANTDLFQPAGLQPQDRSTRPYALFFGALAPWQGIRVLLDAVRHPDWPADVDLLVAGDGTERAAVTEAAERDTRVQYLGVLPYRELPKVIAASLVAVSPQINVAGRSDTGLFPLKVFETMACGVPVIVTDVPGQADMVREYECGVVVPAGDSAALATAVAFLAGTPEMRHEMGLRGRDAAVKEHSWERRAADTAAILEDLLRQSS